MIGSPDFHYFAPVGLARTYLFARDASQEAVLDAIRRGATVACDGLGRHVLPVKHAAHHLDAPEGDLPLRLARAPDGQPWAHAWLRFALRLAERRVERHPRVAREAFGFVALEALTLGRPVIASSGSGFAEIIARRHRASLPPEKWDEIRDTAIHLLRGNKK